MSAQRPRTRLTPEARRTQLLDTAKTMIVEHGLQSFTMESLARTAAVSSPLVYNYFESRQVLLKALLSLEQQRFAQRLKLEISAAKDYEAIVRIFIASNFDHYAPGNILPILQSQPEIADAANKFRHADGQQAAKFLVQSTANTYKISKSQALLLVSMSSGASIAAAELNAGKPGNRNKAIDTALAYVLAGMRHIAG